MNKSRKQNDWEKIVKAQTYSIQAADFQEKSLIDRNKKNYSKALESQLQEKSLAKAKELKSKEQDALMIYSNLNDFNQFQERKQIFHKELKKQMYEELSNHTLNKELNNSRSAAMELAVDNKNLDESRTRISQEEVIRANKKKERENQEVNFLNLKYLRNEREKKMKELEKKSELDLVHGSIEKINKQEKDYLDMYTEILNKQNMKSKSYSQVAIDKQLGEIAHHELISKWDNEYKQKLLAQEKQDIEFRRRRKLEEGLILQQQIYEKSIIKEQEKLQIEKEKEYIDLTALRHKHNDYIRKLEENSRKEQYRNILEAQLEHRRIEKLNENTLNFKEQLAHSPILRLVERNEEIEFKGIPGVYKERSPLKSALLSNSKSQRLFHPVKTSVNLVKTPTFSPEPTPKIVPRKISRHRTESDFHLEKHNPITNPIGDISPCRSHSSFHRGRGLSKLNK